MATNKKSKSSKPKSLTCKEYQFLMEYFKDWDRNRAYNKVYQPKKPQNTRFYAHEILQKPHIIAAIKAFKDELKEEAKVTVEELARPLKQTAQAKLLDYIDPKTNKLLNLADTPNPHAIKKLKTTETTTGTGKKKVTKVVAELELHDPKAANESLRKLYGMDEQPDELTDKSIKVTVEIVKPE